MTKFAVIIKSLKNLGSFEDHKSFDDNSIMFALKNVNNKLKMLNFFNVYIYTDWKKIIKVDVYKLNK